MESNDSVVNTISVGNGPSHIIFSPNSKFAYVSIGGIMEEEEDVTETMADMTEEDDGNVSIVNLENGEAREISVGRMPHGLRMTPDNKY